jgi:N-acetylglucosaminyl-diphospho-decaprenol L-rhamnosyltransferase
MRDDRADPLGRCGAVIVAHSRLDHARACVDSLRRDLPPDRIVVVFNDPCDAPEDDLGELGAHAVVVSPLRPTGYGANLNLGVRILGDAIDACVLANDDVVFEPGCVARLVDALAHEPRVAVAGPRALNRDGSEQLSHWRFPSVRGEVRRVAVPSQPLWAVRPGARDDEADDGAGPVHHVDCVTGAAFVVRVDAFRAVGGFDEEFFLYYEETDLCFRLRRAGWSIVSCDDARVVHALGASLPRAGEGGLARASRRLYFRKRLGTPRFRLFQAALSATFAAAATSHLAPALVRPGSATRRLTAVRDRWNERLFF